MSSLLTNNSAMVALQTLKTINKDMGSVQNQISTGKRIANAQDNAALWGISTTMKSDVTGFKAISESLSLGSATLSVARDGAETITTLLDTLKGKIVAAQEENVDRTKIQADVDALVKQIGAVTDGAQFNGLNLLKGTDTINVLASLDRDADQNVTSTNVSFTKQDLSQDAGSLDLVNGTSVTGVAISGGDSTVTVANSTRQTIDFGTMAITDGDGSAGDGTLAVTIAGASYNVTVATGDDAATIAGKVEAVLNDGGTNEAAMTAAGITVSVSGNEVRLDSAFGIAGTALDVTGIDTVANAASNPADVAARAETVQITSAAAGTIAEGSGYQVTLGAGATAQTFLYTAQTGDDGADVTAGLAAAINASADITGVTTRVSTDGSGNELLQIDYDGTDTNFGATSVAVAVASSTVSLADGGLYGLADVDVTTSDGATAALNSIEGFIQTAIDAAAAFGSAQGRIQTQSEFVSKVMDGLTSGIGTLVDADMEEASARLQALQVQQQLGIQALSIANQSPQNILALFR